MSIVNSFLRQNKGLTSFLFVIIFLYSGIVRGVITSKIENYVPNYTCLDSKTKSNLTSQQNHFTGLSIANQYKDKGESETDEAHFEIDFTFTSYSPVAFLPYPKFSGSIEFNWSNFLKLPLYDLFCNWKYHFI